MILYSDMITFLREIIQNGNHKGISNRFYKKVIDLKLLKSICRQDVLGIAIKNLVNEISSNEEMHVSFLNFAKCFCESLLHHRYFKTIKLIKSDITAELKYEILTFRCYDDLRIFDYACEDDNLVEYACKY